MSRYICLINGYANGEVVAPRFNPDGTIKEAGILYLDEENHMHQEISNSFVPLPVSWNDWTIANAPTGAHLYVNGDKFANPAHTSSELADAERYRQKLIAQRQTEGNVTQPVDEPAPQTHGNEPEAPAAPDLAPPPEVEPTSDPADLNKDGVVTPKERKLARNLQEAKEA